MLLIHHSNEYHWAASVLCVRVCEFLHHYKDIYVFITIFNLYIACIHNNILPIQVASDNQNYDVPYKIENLISYLYTMLVTIDKEVLH